VAFAYGGGASPSTVTEMGVGATYES
jgi:hypothetical protein